MKTKSTIVVLAFSVWFVQPSKGFGQQDPNWRQRTLEEVRRIDELLKRINKEIKEMEDLNHGLERLKRKQDAWEKNLRRILDRPYPSPNSRFFDIYEYGPPIQGRYFVDA